MTCKKECMEYDCECLPRKACDTAFAEADISAHILTGLIMICFLAAILTSYHAGRTSEIESLARYKMEIVCNGIPFENNGRTFTCIETKYAETK